MVKKSVYLVGGNDEFTIKQSAAKLAEQLSPKDAGEFGTEIVEGTAANQGEALEILRRLQQALEKRGVPGGRGHLVEDLAKLVLGFLRASQQKLGTRVVVEQQAVELPHSVSGSTAAEHFP